MTNRHLSKIGSLAVAMTLGTALAVSGASDAVEGDDLPASLRLSYTIYTTSAITPTGDPTCPLRAVIDGAGITNLLGPIHDEQSHCVQLDGSIDQGVVTFTGASLGGPPGGSDSRDSITAQYRAHMVPTARSILPTATTPPGGFWLIYGELCVWKGTGKFANVIDDCPTPGTAGQFVAARGTLDIDTGQASIFGFEVIRLSEPMTN